MVRLCCLEAGRFMWMRGSLQPPLNYPIFIHAEIMAEFVEQGGVDFLTKDLFLSLRLFPKILQKQDDLWRQRNCRAFLVGEFGADKQTECVRLDAVAELPAVRVAFEGHWQSFSSSAQRRGHGRKRGLDFFNGQRVQSSPIYFHGESLNR